MQCRIDREFLELSVQHDMVEGSPLPFSCLRCASQKIPMVSITCFNPFMAMLKSTTNVFLSFVFSITLCKPSTLGPKTYFLNPKS